MRADAAWLRRAVAAVVALVPPGRVVSYGDVAELLGVGPRQVGAIMAAGPEPGAAQLPWWRVTNAAGTLPVHLLDEAVAHWRAEGTTLRRDNRGVAIRTRRADLPALADAAEAMLGPLPGGTGLHRTDGSNT
ncbi:alkylated DNA nucleotide flippase Atl1 [Kineosphaera limosa]|uniref:Methylated-DNA-[protein]-cysteine S-methyltransferase DNA binding domain-containing protein n=1 Tax=Kineosphaera limosa NBRC 100340 TaxID=1184609 RepID=K6X6X4_9MICO|nr:MGMT family protein [Kineosphaera limosa]NYD99439.1 alkylated DNA nucleotide flippase Atl1 [Kineosphaera limosa]GAB94579.1 hypothetical protein KILIM_007_00170 [Kineosphaera limosa NBRC 100340]